MNKYLLIPVFILILMAELVRASATPDSISVNIPDSSTLSASDTLSVSDTIPSDVTITPSALPAHPKRTITPVDIDDDRMAPVWHYYDKHGEPLDEPVLFLAALDTVTKPKAKPNFPLYTGTTIGAHFGDLIMMAFGQKFQSYDLYADVSLHNWFFPTIEAGVGFSNATPDNRNFTYHVNPSLYLKLGINYNFLYKSNPDYQLFFGIRAGFSSFRWELRNVSIESSYWQENQNFNLPGMKSTAFWGEALAGLRVRIVSGFSLGWSIRVHYLFSASKGKPSSLPAGLLAESVSKPWFIPGYGGTSPFVFSLSASWTFGPKAKPESTEGAPTP